MCAILDANVSHEVFGRHQTEAGRVFFRWLNERHGRLAVGGKARRELAKNATAGRWLVEGIRAGRVQAQNDDEVDRLSGELEDACRSDDPHIIALAQVSRARLLYSNDQPLHQDFGNKDLVDRPRGKVFSTQGSPHLTNVHQRLLNRRDLCSQGN